MTARERFIETLTFGTPDRVPFQPGGPRESTVAKWREQGLPAGRPWSEVLHEEIRLVRRRLGGEHCSSRCDRKRPLSRRVLHRLRNQVASAFHWPSRQNSLKSEENRQGGEGSRRSPHWAGTPSEGAPGGFPSRDPHQVNS